MASPHLALEFLEQCVSLPERTGENKMKTALAALIVGYGLDLAAWRSLLFVPSDPCGSEISLPCWKNGCGKVFPKTPKGELAGGVFLVILVCLAGYGVPALLLFAAFKIHPVIGFLLRFSGAGRFRQRNA